MLESLAVQWVVGGVLGNVADRTLCGVVRHVQDRLAGARNHDVERAITDARFDALKHFVKDFKTSPLHDRTRTLSQSERFFDRMLEFCHTDRGRSFERTAKSDEEQEDSKNLMNRMIDSVPSTLDRPHDGPAVTRLNQIARLAEDAILKEIRKACLREPPVELPEGFEKHFREGYLDTHPRFLEMFGAYFSEQIKNNDRCRAIFTTIQLSRLEARALDGLELSRAIHDRFDPLLERVHAIKADTEQTLTVATSIASQVATLETTQHAHGAALDRIYTDLQHLSESHRDAVQRLTGNDVSDSERARLLAGELARHLKPSAPIDEAGQPPQGRLQLDVLDQLASLLGYKELGDWATAWRSALDRLVSSGQISESARREVLGYVFGEQPDDVGGPELGSRLNNFVSYQRSLRGVSQSQLVHAIQLGRHTRIHQILAAIHLGLDITAEHRGIAFVLIPPGTLHQPPGLPIANPKEFYLSRAIITCADWQRLGGAVDGAVDGSPLVSISISSIRGVLGSGIAPWRLSLPSEAMLRFALRANTERGLLGLVPERPPLGCFCEESDDRVQVVRSDVTLPWLSTIQRHREVGFRLVYSPEGH